MRQKLLLGVWIATIGLQAVAEEPCFYGDACGCEEPLYYTSLEYLYWKAWPEALLFAVDGLSVSAGQQGTGSFQKGSWDSGVRATVGRTFCQESFPWNLEATYTWFKTSSTDTRHAGSLPLLPTMLDTAFSSPGAPGSPISKISDAWHLSYQIADVTFAKAWGEGLWAWSPYLGARGALISTKSHIHTLYTNPAPNVTDDIQKSDSKECGLNGGIGMQLHFTPALSFCSSGGLSVLWAWNQLHFSYSDSAAAVYDNVEDSFSSLQMVFDAAVGLEYARLLDCCFFHQGCWGCRLSWEFHYWPEQEKFLMLTGANDEGVQNIFVSSSALYVQGLSLRLFLNW